MLSLSVESTSHMTVQQTPLFPCPDVVWMPVLARWRSGERV